MFGKPCGQFLVMTHQQDFRLHLRHLLRRHVDKELDLFATGYRPFFKRCQKTVLSRRSINNDVFREGGVDHGRLGPGPSVCDFDGDCLFENALEVGSHHLQADRILARLQRIFVHQHGLQLHRSLGIDITRLGEQAPAHGCPDIEDSVGCARLQFAEGGPEALGCHALVECAGDAMSDAVRICADRIDAQQPLAGHPRNALLEKVIRACEYLIQTISLPIGQELVPPAPIQLRILDIGFTNLFVPANRSHQIDRAADTALRDEQGQTVALNGPQRLDHIRGVWYPAIRMLIAQDILPDHRTGVADRPDLLFSLAQGEQRERFAVRLVARLQHPVTPRTVRVLLGGKVLVRDPHLSGGVLHEDSQGGCVGTVVSVSPPTDTVDGVTLLDLDRSLVFALGALPFQVYQAFKERFAVVQQMDACCGPLGNTLEDS